MANKLSLNLNKTSYMVFSNTISMLPGPILIHKLEGHSVEHTTPPCNAWSTITYLAQYIFEISCYISFLSPIFQGWRITLKIILVGSGSSPKSNQFVVVTHPTCLPSFIRIRPQLFEMSCYISVSPDLSMVKNQLKNLIILVSGFGSSPKLEQFFLVTHPLVHKVSPESVHNFLRYPAHR